MKKFLAILLSAFLFISFSFSQERELSDYEKYRMEQERTEQGVQVQEVFYIVEDMPTFQGEDAKEFRKWIAQNVKYPENAIKNGVTGKVIVQFVVNSDGNVVNAQVPESVNEDLDREAIRVVEASPKWKPGVQRGVAVNVQFTFPINFVLDEQVASNDEATTIVNNYYIEDNNYDDWVWRNNISYRLTFGHSYYNHYRYSYYGSYYPYYGGYYGYNYYDPYYYGGYYGYYGYYGNYWNRYYGHNHYYNHNRYYTNNYNRGRHYASSGALGTNRNYYTPYNKTYRSGYVSNPYTSAKKSPYNAYTKSRVVTKPTANINRNGDPVQRINKNTAVRPNTNRNTTVKTTRVTPNGRNSSPYTRVLQDGNKNSKYTPTYTNPRTPTKASYNKVQRTTTVRTTPKRSQGNTYNSKSTQNRTRSSSTYSRPSSSSRSYSTPTRSGSSYSSGSRSSGSSFSRSSGSASRSSGGSRSSGKK